MESWSTYESLTERRKKPSRNGDDHDTRTRVERENECYVAQRRNRSGWRKMEKLKMYYKTNNWKHMKKVVETEWIKWMQTNRCGQWEIYHIIDSYLGSSIFHSTLFSQPSKRLLNSNSFYMPLRAHKLFSGKTFVRQWVCTTVQLIFHNTVTYVPNGLYFVRKARASCW